MIGLAMASLIATGGVFVDEGRIDYPDRNLSQFLLACYTIYTPSTYMGFNCTESAFQAMVNTPAERQEPVVVTALDADNVYLVDQPCVLTSVSPIAGGMFYSVTCYDNDEIFSDGFQ